MQHAILFTIAAVGLSVSANAATNLVTNGSFESSIYTDSHEFGVNYGGQGVTDWTATLRGGISYYFYAGTASTVVVDNRQNDQLAMLAASYPGSSPDGGNFVGFDSDTAAGANSPFDQTITGLQVGKRYVVNYYWAGTQLQNRTGATTSQMTVTFGGVTQSTPIVNVPDQGFVGWTAASAHFTATSVTDTLSFLAIGTPAGLPPFALLDGVSLTALPEPAAWGLMIVGFGLVGATARRRRQFVTT